MAEAVLLERRVGSSTELVMVDGEQCCESRCQVKVEGDKK
jgi:hypothetical protein